MKRLRPWLILILTLAANLAFGWICAFIVYFKSSGLFGQLLPLRLPTMVALISFAAVLIHSQWLRHRPIVRWLMVLAGTYLLSSISAFMNIAYMGGAVSVAMQVAKHYGIQR